MVEQGDDAVADQAGRRVVAGDDELVQARQQFLLGEAFFVVARVDEYSDQVVEVLGAMGGDETHEGVDDRIGCGDGLGRR